ncbi:MAG: diguanylate cyclase [bacterium]|nr:diguanylate cyclase [bacterium]
MGVEEKLKGLELVYYDDLTGIFNKRFFNNLKNFLSGKILFTIFDIDNFKNINDTHGHLTGDYILKKVSTTLVDLITKGDFPIRYGGDEFILISSLKTKDDFLKFLEIFKERIEKSPIIFNNTMIKITLSFGVSEGDVENVEVIFENADNALYSSKEKGKNCITVFEKGRVEDIKIPFKCEREIKKCLSEGKNVIVKGGFRAGKTFLKNILEKQYPYFSFIDYKQSLESIPEKNVCFFYNPIFVEKDKNLVKILNNLKRGEYREFVIENLHLDEISRSFEIFLKEKSIFLLNFLFDITTGNRFLLSKFLKEKKELFEIDILEYLNDDFDLEDDVESKIKSILKFGLLIDLKKIKSKEELKILDILSNRMVLKNIKGFYRYLYPPLYFYLTNKYRIERKYPETIKTFEDFKFRLLKKDDKNLLKISEKLYYYGDNLLSKKMIKKINGEDERKLIIMSKIYIAEGNLNGAEICCQKIKKEAKRNDIKFLLDLLKGKKINWKLCITDNQKLLYLSFLYNHLELKKFENFSNKIDYKGLDNRQKMTYDFLMGNYETLVENYKKALFHLERCKRNCEKNNFIGDLGKVYMSLGILYDDMENYELSLDNYNKALEIFKYSNMENALQSLYLNLAVLYSKIGDFSTSLDLFSSLLAGEVVKNNINFKRNILNNLSHLYFNIYDFNKSRYYRKELYKTFAKNERIPDHIKLHSVKLDIIEGFIPNRKLDYFNKKDIINKLEILVINFIINNKKEVKKEIFENFLNKLLNISPGKNILVKSELLIFLLIFYKDKEEIVEILKEKIFENLSYLKLNTRINYLFKFLE